ARVVAVVIVVAAEVASAALEAAATLETTALLVVRAAESAATTTVISATVATGTAESEDLAERRLTDLPGRFTAKRVAANTLEAVVDHAVLFVFRPGREVVGRRRPDVQLTLQTDLPGQPDAAAK